VSYNSRQGILNATMNIVRRNAGEKMNWHNQPGTNNSTGNGLRSSRIKIRANVAKSTYVKVGRIADVGNVMIEIEMVVKCDAKELDVV
jgi:hypothetical protein